VPVTGAAIAYLLLRRQLAALEGTAVDPPPTPTA
jgi:hypothetical protein